MPKYMYIYDLHTVYVYIHRYCRYFIADFRSEHRFDLRCSMNRSQITQKSPGLSLHTESPSTSYGGFLKFGDPIAGWFIRGYCLVFVCSIKSRLAHNQLSPFFWFDGNGVTLYSSTYVACLRPERGVWPQLVLELTAFHREGSPDFPLLGWVGVEKSCEFSRFQGKLWKPGTLEPKWHRTLPPWQHPLSTGHNSRILFGFRVLH